MSHHLFIPCTLNLIYPDKVSLISETLNFFKIETKISADQKCCGLHKLTAGFHEDALKLGEHFIDQNISADKIIIPSADCVFHIKNNFSSLFKNTSYHLDHKKIQSATVEYGDFISDFLPNDQILGEFRAKILYINPNSMIRDLSIGNKHLELFNKIQSLEVVIADKEIEHPGIDQGFYRNFPEISTLFFEALEKFALKKTCSYIVCSETAWYVEFDAYLKKNRSAIILLTISDLIHASMRGYLPQRG